MMIEFLVALDLKLCLHICSSNQFGGVHGVRGVMDISNKVALATLVAFLIEIRQTQSLKTVISFFSKWTTATQHSRCMRTMARFL